MLPVIPPLTYGVVKANKAVIDQVVADGLDYTARVEAAIAFIHLAAPEFDCDSVPPGILLGASMELYKATFYRPEDAAPAQPNP
jgi:hypothetical protein